MVGRTLGFEASPDCPCLSVLAGDTRQICRNARSWSPPQPGPAPDFSRDVAQPLFGSPLAYVL